MKLNIAYLGSQKFIEIDDEKKLRCLYDKRISQEVPGEDLGEEFAGYVFRITGGNDKQGFAMKQGVLTNTRVRLLLKEGLSGYRPRRTGERKRKSVRGCIVGADLSVLNLVVTKKGDSEIEGLTDVSVPKRLGPKRANKIRKLFNLSGEDDVRKLTREEVITKLNAVPTFTIVDSEDGLVGMQSDDGEDTVCFFVDAADIERSWQAVAHHKEGVIADVADRVLLDLVSEVEEIVLAKR